VLLFLGVAVYVAVVLKKAFVVDPRARFLERSGAPIIRMVRQPERELPELLVFFSFPKSL
jgi:hypothetical protein